MGRQRNQPEIAVVVPVRNGAGSIGRCIEALLAQDHPAGRHEIVIVDNGSTDDTAAAIRSHPVTYAHEPEPGVSNARNRGIAETTAPLVAFLDGDCIPRPGWLSAIAAPFADPEVGCVAGELGHVEPETMAQRQAVRVLGGWQRFAISSNPPFAVTANAAYRRSVLNEIGWFDPQLSRGQDVELGIRFHHLSSLQMVFAPDAVAVHRHKETHYGFFRQQLGWAYGAGMVAAKREAIDGNRSPRPKASALWRNVWGMGLVLRERARGSARDEWVEDAWFNLMQQAGWFVGGNAGMLHGSRIWRGADDTPPRP